MGNKTVAGGPRRSPPILTCLVLIAALLCLGTPDQLLAQTEKPAEIIIDTEDRSDDGVFVAPVEVDGDALFVVRGSSALPATERAANIEERIIEMGELSRSQPIVITQRKNEFGRAILANGRMLTITTRADAEFEQLDIDVLAGLHAEAIEAAIDQYRLSRTNDARVDSALVAVGWTIAFLIVSVLFFRKRHAVVNTIEKLTENRFTQVEEATGSVVQGRAVAQLAGFLCNVLLWTILLFLLYYYLSFVLLSFAETRPFAEILLTYVSEPMIDVIWGFISYLPNLVTLLIIFLVTHYVIKGLRLFIENVEAGTFELPNFEPHWVAPTFNIARVVIIAIAFVFAYPYIPGSDSRAFQGLTILAGLMVSLGSNTVISNMMAGLFLIYRRSTNIGDRIKVGEQIGDVIEVKLMETMIKSIKNEMISIPNAQLLNSEVVNYSRKIDGRGLLVHSTVGIGYEEPQEKVEAMLIEAANRTGGIKKSPEPFVLWIALADYAINYQINAFTTRGSSLPKIVSDLHRNIVAVFNENNVQIMTPSYIADPDVPKLQTEKWDGKLAPSD